VHPLDASRRVRQGYDATFVSNAHTALRGCWLFVDFATQRSLYLGARLRRSATVDESSVLAIAPYPQRLGYSILSPTADGEVSFERRHHPNVMATATSGEENCGPAAIAPFGRMQASSWRACCAFPQTAWPFIP
jgi:hypothetical protein